MAASAAQLPPNYFGQMAASAAQFPPNFNGQMAASAAHVPRFSATPLHSPAQTGASASLLSTLCSNPAISQLFNTIRTQAISSKPVMPWEELAKIYDVFVQDPFMPKGFKRLSVTKVIEAAKAKRSLAPAHIDISRAVTYPVMRSFNQAEFIRTRKEYVSAIKASTISGMFNSFKSCLGETSQNAAKGVFFLTEERFIELEDEVFMRWCALLFGPGNKKEAIKLLKSVKIYQNDNEHEQSEFVAKFDQV
jgi:hypothetical protein